MPPSTSISISASPEIARFGGMVFHVFYDDHLKPHVEVTVKGTKYRFSLLDGKPLPAKAKAFAIVSEQVQAWLKTEVPGLTRTINDLVYDQWLKIRNGQPVERVPTPDEIKVMGRPKKTPKKSTRRYNHYAIKRIQVLPDFHLKVGFANGDVKVVDVKAMRGHNEMFAQVWKNFDQAKSEVCIVLWPVMFPDGPNTIEIEDQDLWGAGVEDTSE